MPKLFYQLDAVLDYAQEVYRSAIFTHDENRYTSGNLPKKYENNTLWESHIDKLNKRSKDDPTQSDLEYLAAYARLVFNAANFKKNEGINLIDVEILSDSLNYLKTLCTQYLPMVSHKLPFQFEENYQQEDLDNCFNLSERNKELFSPSIFLMSPDLIPVEIKNISTKTDQPKLNQLQSTSSTSTQIDLGNSSMQDLEIEKLNSALAKCYQLSNSKEEFDHYYQMSKLINNIKILHGKANEYKLRSENPNPTLIEKERLERVELNARAYVAAKNLCSQLTDSILNYVDSGQTLNAYNNLQQKSKEIIKDHKPELENYRDNTLIINNIIGAIAGLGLIYGLVLLGNYLLSNCRCTLLQTKGAIIVNDIEDALDNIPAPAA